LEVRRNVALPPGTTLLLDGFCQYVGPAIVFETDWETSGALQIAYGDETLKGDVVSPSMQIADDAVTTMSYGQPEARYAYGEKLWLYNVRRKTTYRLTGSLLARQYFQTVNPNKDSGCAPGKEGSGTPVL
jgi:hypothetical protein